MKKLINLKLLSLLSLYFVIFVILWGAFVRASKSGAGCGAHWPLCNGEILISNPSTEKLIEFTHRLTSGLSFILVGLTYALSRKDKYTSTNRQFAKYSFIFIIIEALIGAGLVLFGWVKDDRSISRAYVVAGHLINSFALLACLSILVFSIFITNENIFSVKKVILAVKKNYLTLILFILVGSFGAVTALGDTLFPATSIVDGLKDDMSSSSHFLIKLRVIHPILALLLASRLLVFFTQNEDKAVKFPDLSKLGQANVILQILVGILTIYFLAPVYLQITHLALGVSLWILYILKLCKITASSS